MSLVSKDQRCLVRKYLADAIRNTALLHRPLHTSIGVNPGGGLEVSRPAAFGLGGRGRRGGRGADGGRGWVVKD